MRGFINIFALLMALGLNACGGGDSSDPAACASATPNLCKPLSAASTSAGTVATTDPALYTTSPSAITIPIGTTVTYTIGGGTSPYAAISSNTSVATATIAGSTLTISSVAQGTSQIAVVDATGQAVTTTVGPSTAPALFTTAPSAVTMTSGGSATYTIGGGTAPYTATSGNTNVATASAAGTTLTINSIAPGTAPIAVADSTGSSVTINTTVLAPAATGIAPSIFPASITTGDCTTNIPFVFTGGTAPFTISTSDTADVQVSAVMPLGSNSFFTASVRSLYLTLDVQNAAGVPTTSISLPKVATVTVTDSQSRTATATIDIVTAHLFCPTNALLQATPASANVAVAEVLYFQIVGGLAPFSVTSNAPGIANVIGSVGRSFNAQAIAAGVALLTVTSADGQKANITFTSF